VREGGEARLKLELFQWLQQFFYWWRGEIKVVDIQSLTAGKVENVPCFCIKQIFVDNDV
jgi:hypothetical protein